MKYLFYLLPGLLNLVMGLFFFITAKRLADAGASSLAVTATTAIWALIYSAASFMIGKYTTRSNAVKIMLISQFILLGSILGLLFSPDVKMQYLWLLFTGLGTGLFFAPFQTVVKMFEKVEISTETFARSAGFYTCSWSIGQGCGQLLVGVIWGAFDPLNGWKYCYMINIAVLLAVIGTLLIMAKFIRKKLAEAPQNNLPDNAQEQHIPSPGGQPDIMKAIWFMALGGFLGVGMLRAYLPDYCTKTLDLSTSTQAYTLTLINLFQGAIALCCIKSRRWPFRPWGLLGASVLCIASLLIMGSTGSGAMAQIAAAMFGCFSGLLAFNMTFHALANADKSSRYAAGNETIVGITSILAPISAGWIADISTPQLPFYILILIIGCCAVIFTSQTWKHRKF